MNALNRERQKTFAGEWLPVSEHPIDSVLTSDNGFQERGNCHLLTIPYQISSLILEECHDVIVTMEDTKRAGCCNEGVKSFLSKHFAGKDHKTITVGMLRRTIEYAEVNRSYVLSVMRVACKRSRPIGNDTVEYWYDMEAYQTRRDELEEEIIEYNHEILGEYFEAHSQWTQEYVESEEYWGEYAYLMRENDTAETNMVKILESDGVLNSDVDYPEEVIADIWDSVYQLELFVGDTCNEYASIGDRHLDGFGIGEYEDQIEVSRVREDIGDDLILTADSEFTDLLEDYCENGSDHCLRGSSLNREYATLELYLNTGIRVDWELLEGPELEEATTKAIVSWCEKRDDDRIQKLVWGSKYPSYCQFMFYYDKGE